MEDKDLGAQLSTIWFFVFVVATVQALLILLFKIQNSGKI